MGKTKISVIYTTYRYGGFDILADSLRHQTVKDYELIVIDDLTVNRSEMVRKYLEDNGINAKYIGPSKPHCFADIAYNLINAWNTGVLASTGDILVFIGDYTWLPPNALDKFLQYEDTLKKGCAITGIAHYWRKEPIDVEKELTHLISIWKEPWKGNPEQNGWSTPTWWVPEVFESFYFAVSYDLLLKTNAFQECYDNDTGDQIVPFLKKAREVGADFFVDKENICEMIHHRDWEPHDTWHHAKKRPSGSTTLIERENCFNLKTHKRGALNTAKKNVKTLQQQPPYVCKNDIIKQLTFGKIVDVGCFDGHMFWDKAVNVDIIKYADNIPNFVLAGADTLPFVDNTFDCAVYGEVLEHVDDPIKTLNEAKRIANAIIFSVPNEYEWIPEYNPFSNPGHKRFFTEETIKKLFADVNIELDQFLKVNFCGWSHFVGRGVIKKMLEIEHGMEEEKGEDDSLKRLASYEKGEEEKGEEKAVGARQRKKTCLNIGSFTVCIKSTETERWINIDILDLSDWMKQYEYEFRQADVTKGLNFADNSIDFIVASHFIEHIEVDEGIQFLKECLRVLKPRGTIRLCIPDLKKLIDTWLKGTMSDFDDIQPKEYAEAKSGAQRFWMLLTSGHKTCYDAWAITRSLELASFDTIHESEFNEQLDMFPTVSITVAAQKPAKKPIPVPFKEENSKPLYKQYLDGNIQEGKEKWI